jgi:[protein-PII] uridylyltransferase
VLEELEAREHGVSSVLALRRDTALAALHGRFADDVVERHLRLLPPRYLLVSSPDAIGQHLELIARAGSGIALRHDALGDFERLTIVTVDRPGILAAVAGTLAVHDVSVLGGSAYTRDDGVVIDVLHVADGRGIDIDEARWASIAEVLPQAIADEFPIAQRLLEAQRLHQHRLVANAPTSVHVNNAASAQYSVIEVSAEDRPGLLYTIAHTLHESALDIHLAKIETIGDEVADAFYVLRRNGRRVEAPDEIQRICGRIAEAINALDASV